MTLSQTLVRQNSLSAYAVSVGIFLWALLCLWGAASDRAYKEAGGVRPTREAKELLVALIAVSLGFLVALYIGKREVGIVGNFATVLSVLIFGAWEILRWRVRRKHRLRK